MLYLTITDSPAPANMCFKESGSESIHGYGVTKRKFSGTYEI